MWAYSSQMFQSQLESGQLVLPGHSLPAPLVYLLPSPSLEVHVLSNTHSISVCLTWVQTNTYKTRTECTITLRVNTE